MRFGAQARISGFDSCTWTAVQDFRNQSRHGSGAGCMVELLRISRPEPVTCTVFSVHCCCSCLGSSTALCTVSLLSRLKLLVWIDRGHLKHALAREGVHREQHGSSLG